MVMYSERREYEDLLLEAMHVNDDVKISFYQDLCLESNLHVHELYRHFISMPEPIARQGYLASLKNELESDKLSSSVHHRRTPDVDPKRSLEQESGSRSSHLRERSGRNPNYTNMKGGCPPHQFQFVIWLEYNDHETTMGIWDTMPLPLIFAYAHEWVTQEVSATINEDRMMLVLKPNTMLDNTGYVFEVPILADQIIEIQEDISAFDSQIKRITAPQKPILHHELNRAAFTPLKPRPHSSMERVVDESMVTPGLASASYDRI